VALIGYGVNYLVTRYIDVRSGQDAKMTSLEFAGVEPKNSAASAITLHSSTSVIDLLTLLDMLSLWRRGFRPVVAKYSEKTTSIGASVVISDQHAGIGVEDT
jgi:hypothetical protein